MVTVFDLLVTRHDGLAEYLRRHNVQWVKRLSHATAADVKGKHVIGVLPLSLAVEAATVTEVPLPIPEELRGADLTADQVETYAQRPVTYAVAGGIQINYWLSHGGYVGTILDAVCESKGLHGSPHTNPPVIREKEPPARRCDDPTHELEGADYGFSKQCPSCGKRVYP